MKILLAGPIFSSFPVSVEADLTFSLGSISVESRKSFSNRIRSSFKSEPQFSAPPSFFSSSLSFPKTENLFRDLSEPPPPLIDGENFLVVGLLAAPPQVAERQFSELLFAPKQLLPDDIEMHSFSCCSPFRQRAHVAKQVLTNTGPRSVAWFLNS